MILAIYLIGIVPAWFPSAGMLFSSLQFCWSEAEGARKWRRRDAGIAIAVGGVYAAAWPVLLPVGYCISGFAEHGIWRSPK